MQETTGSISGSRRSPGGGTGKPTPVFLPEKSHGGAWRAAVHGAAKELGATEHINLIICYLQLLLTTFTERLKLV